VRSEGGRDSTGRRIRVVLAKVGFDGHDRGVKVVALGLLDAGMEVIYTGLYSSPEEVVATTIQEDADVLAISCLSGGHLAIFSSVVALLKKQQRGGLLLLAGGTIPQDEVSVLKAMGVSEVFRTGSKIPQIVEYIRKNVRPLPSSFAKSAS
jgi:methylmalonyl-CoA mutase C-terminal domain/subunit